MQCVAKGRKSCDSTSAKRDQDYTRIHIFKIDKHRNNLAGEQRFFVFQEIHKNVQNRHTVLFSRCTLFIFDKKYELALYLIWIIAQKIVLFVYNSVVSWFITLKWRYKYMKKFSEIKKIHLWEPFCSFLLHRTFI